MNTPLEKTPSFIQWLFARWILPVRGQEMMSARPVLVPVMRRPTQAVPRQRSR
jgi:hypothetical protein